MGDVIRQPALAWAVRHGRNTEAVSLLQHGADPNLPNSSYAVFETLDDILRQSPLADLQVDSIHQLLLHGADPNPWIFVAFQHYARSKGRNDLLNLALTSRQGVKSEWIRSAIESTGRGDARIEAIFQYAMAIRDARECPNNAPPNELAICLPNSLRNADDAIDARLSEVAADKGPGSRAEAQQRQWVAELDRKCGLRVSSSSTRAGWLSYALSDQTRALCVLNEAHQRRTGMGVAAR
jgi:uncharacterized protein YecT (DUF1311 family)